MKTSEKYKYWAMLSDYDMDTAKVLIEGKRWAYVAYVCQQALERQLKGMYVYHTDKEAPKSHNLGYLFEKICATPAFDADGRGVVFQKEKEACEDFLTEMMFYYMSDYPFSYKRIAGRFIDGATGRELYARTGEWLGWLRSLQPMCERLTPEEIRQQP